MRSQMLEGKEDFATLEDVDRETFGRFVEWLYRGHYHAAMPTQSTSPDQPSGDGSVANALQSSTSAFSFPPKLDSQGSTLTEAPQNKFSVFETPPSGASGAGASLFGAPAVGETPQSTNGFSGKSEKAIRDSVPQWHGPNPFGTSVVTERQRSPFGDSRGPQTQRKQKPETMPSSTGQKAKDFFFQRKYNIRQTVKSLPQPLRQTVKCLPQPRQNIDKYENYSEVFLCHAHLHIFAEKYDVQPLKVLAVEELHAALATFTLYQERTGDILKLLRYVYKEAPVQTNKMEDLRTLMTQYVDSEVETLIKDENLGKHLMEDGGALLEDFLKVARRRLV